MVRVATLFTLVVSLTLGNQAVMKASPQDFRIVLPLEGAKKKGKGNLLAIVQIHH